MTADLQAYGWERGRDTIWRQTKPHLVIVPDDEPLSSRTARTTRNARGGRDYRTSLCACGGPKSPRAQRCRACLHDSHTRNAPTMSDADVAALTVLLDQWIRAIPVAPLPVHLCDCGCLLRLDEALCPECRHWAERNATDHSWRTA